MGDIPTSPSTIFGKKKETREVSGPSLSATDEPVADIRIVGNSTIPTSKILNELQTRVGRPFDPALIQRDIRTLTARGWFVDVQPTYQQTPAGRVVTLKVAERPVVRYVEYLGNSGLRTKKLQQETDLKVGGPVDPYAVQEAKRKLIDLYRRNGFNNAQVSVLEGDKPTDHGIVFVINEGASQKIWKVEFVGNEFLSASRLKTKIDSKPPLMMLFKGYVDREQIDGDVNKLTAFYRSFGYFDARIGRQLEFDEKNKWLTLRFVIHEGQRYEVESVAFIGNKIFSGDSLTTGVDMKPDPKDRTAVAKLYHMVKPLAPGPQPFEQDRMNSDVAWLKELYGSQGYIFADVRAEPIFLEEPGKLRLMYHIDEGKRWRVGNIFVHIQGDNPHTKIQTALNRLSIRSGEIADIRELRASERRLQASGLFMADPAKGVMPKITYHIPELNDTEMAKGGGNGFRGQSPDANRQHDGNQGISLLAAEGLPDAVPPQGPPLIAPPQYAATAQVTQTYKVSADTGHAADEEALDVHLYFDSEPVPAPSTPPQADANVTTVSQVPASSAVEAPTSVYLNQTEPAIAAPSPKAYEARRPPYDEVSPPVSSNTSEAAWNRPAIVEPAPAAANNYQRLVVRTQSPYQPPTSQPAPAGNTASQAYYQNIPGASTPAAPASGYAASAYGGQTVGATSPDSTAPGSNRYAIRQAAITEPQIPPRASGPTFGSPPTVEPLPTPPQYAPAQTPAPVPGYGPQPIFGNPMGPPAMLAPDPNITPVPPIPTNPQLLPSTPMDPFTPAYDPAADMDVVLSEAQTGRIMLGVAVNSDAGLVGQILLDEQNFDISRPPTSWEDFASGRAWRGAGQHFRLEAAPGTEVQRYLASFTEPYLWNTPVSLGLSGSYFTRRYRDWDEQRTGGRVSFGYQWVENDLSMALSYRGEDVKISNPSTNTLPELNEVVGDNAIHGFKYTVANDTRDSAFLATEGHFLQAEVEQVVGSFTYPRAVFDARQYLLLSERPDHSGRHVVTLSTRLGVTGNDTPIFENFFAGGFSTLRGFEFRGASPVVDNVQVGGRLEWLNTVEYLFPLTADDMIHGVTFVDFGDVEEHFELRQMRVAPGFGLRITVPAMGPAPIALDFAFPIHKADTDFTQIFSFNIGLQR
jgi:outer membrane protein insertion porin family